MRPIVAREAHAQVYWDEWRTRYAQTSRRSSRRSRIVALLIFATVVANLLIQLLERYA